MISIARDEKPVRGDFLRRKRAAIYEPMAQLLSLHDFPEMTFDECLGFVMRVSKGSVDPGLAEEHLISIFEDRGYIVSEVRE